MNTNASNDNYRSSKGLKTLTEEISNGIQNVCFQAMCSVNEPEAAIAGLRRLHAEVSQMASFIEETLKARA